MGGPIALSKLRAIIFFPNYSLFPSFSLSLLLLLLRFYFHFHTLPWQHCIQPSLPIYSHLFSFSFQFYFYFYPNFNLHFCCHSYFPFFHPNLFTCSPLSNWRLFPFQNLLFLQPKFKSEFCKFPGIHKPSFKRTILL